MGSATLLSLGLLAILRLMTQIYALPPNVLSGPQDRRYFSNQFKESDEMCKYAYEPWSSVAEHDRLLLPGPRPTRPLVWTVRAQARVNIIQCICADTRHPGTLSRLNARYAAAGLPLEVAESQPFHLICDERTEFAEIYKCSTTALGSTVERTRRTCGRCSPFSAGQSSGEAGESSNRIVEAGTTECLTVEAKAMFDEVKLWLDSVGGVTGAERHEKWEFATELSFSELGTAFHVSKFNVAQMDVPTNSGHDHVYRACAHRAPGLGSAMLHVKLIRH